MNLSKYKFNKKKLLGVVLLLKFKKLTTLKSTLPKFVEIFFFRHYNMKQWYRFPHPYTGLNFKEGGDETVDQKCGHAVAHILAIEYITICRCLAQVVVFCPHAIKITFLWFQTTFIWIMVQWIPIQPFFFLQ